MFSDFVYWVITSSSPATNHHLKQLYNWFKCFTNWKIGRNGHLLGSKPLSLLLWIRLKQIKYFEWKKCFYCVKGFAKKNGLVKGVQLYKCGNCGKQFLGGNRIINENIWSDYVFGKQTYAQLSEKYSCSIKTVQRRLDQISVYLKKKNPRKIIELTDTTYWGRFFGLMLFKDAITKENLLKYYVKSETNALYIQGIEELKTQGFEVIAIVCDGRKGLISSFKVIPVQMCQFHQSAIIRRYLTKKPKLKVAQELMEVVDLLTKTDK